VRKFLLLQVATCALLLSVTSTQAQNVRPDFSGILFPAGFGARTPNPLPYTAGAQAFVDQYAAEFEIEDDPGKSCIWPGMPRAPWGAPFAIEVIHRDHVLTIIWEGYGMYRKIYMADSNPPEPILPTSMGHSVAHWEGDILVIETTHLKAYPYMSRFATTSNAHLTERMQIVEREIDGRTRRFLAVDIIVTDPQLYTEPVMIHAEAEFRPDLNLLEYTCSVTLWEEYLDSRGLSLPDVDGLPIPD
jgi:hypothetical protein